MANPFALTSELMTQFVGPGVSIAVINGVKIVATHVFGVADVEDGRAGDDGDDVSGGVDQQAGGREDLAEDAAERAVLARPDVDSILMSRQLRDALYERRASINVQLTAVHRERPSTIAQGDG